MKPPLPRPWLLGRCLSSLSSAPSYRPLHVLEDASITRFRDSCFVPELPAALPRQLFHGLPAFDRWFHSSPSDPSALHLNTRYLEQYSADLVVPLELTQSTEDNPSEPTFQQFHAPLSLFLQWIQDAETHPKSTRLYLAQCQLMDLPQHLRDDFPTPDLVAQAGKGDVYDTNIWIGYPPTYTPLHRDPNPNLFVQLAGQKVVRLLAPNDGQKLFSTVRQQLGKSGDRSAAAIRGEEMMQGRERMLLEQAVWGNDVNNAGFAKGYEMRLEAGDGLFIPKGWWHSIKGVGERVTASVNWWFR